MRLIFMGSPDFAAVVLDALVADRHDIACVYAQPPRPAGRGHKARPTPVQARAEAHGLPVRTPQSLKGRNEQDAFAELNADAAIVAAYGLLLPQPVLDAPRLGCWNAHASLLPRWRGCAPIQRAILAGDPETGVCAMKMTAGLDEGPVLLRHSIPIGPQDDAGRLHDRLATLAAATMAEAVRRLRDGDAAVEDQPEDGAVYAPKIAKAEAQIDWRRSAVEVDRLIRAFTPAPGAWFLLDGERWRCGPVDIVADAPSAEPGTVLDDCMTIACGDGAVRPKMLQRPAKAMMTAEAVLCGRIVAPGTVLPCPDTA